jgi:carbonic anhydrase/acetyltransferase-like protein (isoleucine patch superfamily)
LDLFIVRKSRMMADEPPRSGPKICDDQRAAARPEAGGLKIMSDTVRIGSLGDAVPAVHPDAWIAPGAVVVGRVAIGRASSVWYGAVLRADEDEIVVGEECNIQDLCCVHVDEGQPAVLEARVSVGHRATVHGAYLESGSLIGIGAIVLGGARIGTGALVAAGTVVLPGRVVPAGVLYAGVPGRVVRELTEQDREQFRQAPQRYVARVARHRAADWKGTGAC